MPYRAPPGSEVLASSGEPGSGRGARAGGLVGRSCRTCGLGSSRGAAGSGLWAGWAPRISGIQGDRPVCGKGAVLVSKAGLWVRKWAKKGGMAKWP